jgi:hydroxyacylglutathione hydrolase
MSPRGTALNVLTLFCVLSGGLFSPRGEASKTEPTKGVFPSKWIDGVSSNEPPIQIHLYAAKTWILRQSVLTHYEAPFLYLFAGKSSALLWDTGAKAKIPLRESVDKLVGDAFPLTIVHSHGHGDHTAGDSQFIGRPNTKIVTASREAVSSFLEIQTWPTSSAKLDLGERQLEIIPIPGHDACDIALYDSKTQTLLTGDTLYPGRLYIEDEIQYRKSIQRLFDFTKTHPVTWILGNHIEMTKQAGADFGRHAANHPNEHVLELNLEHLLELTKALGASPEKLKHEVHDDFIIVPNH